MPQPPPTVRVNGVRYPFARVEALSSRERSRVAAFCRRFEVAGRAARPDVARKRVDRIDRDIRAIVAIIVPDLPPHIRGRLELEQAVDLFGAWAEVMR